MRLTMSSHYLARAIERTLGLDGASDKELEAHVMSVTSLLVPVVDAMQDTSVCPLTLPIALQTNDGDWFYVILVPINLAWEDGDDPVLALLARTVLSEDMIQPDASVWARSLALHAGFNTSERASEIASLLSDPPRRVSFNL